MKYFKIMLLLGLFSTAQAAVYRWQDASGNTQYGDRPPAGAAAEQVELPELSTYAPPPPREKAPSEDQFDPAVSTETGEVKRYTRLQITQPTNGQTIRTDDGQVNVAVDLRPRLQEMAGHRLIAAVDGRRIPGGSSMISIRATRGSHRLQAAVIDANGKVVARSRVISFDVRPKTRLLIPGELGGIEGIEAGPPVAVPLPAN
jgi:hypothetical protein